MYISGQLYGRNRQWNSARFRNMPSYETSQRALLFLFDSDEMVNRGSVHSGVTANTHPTWRYMYTSHVLFEDTSFQNNSGKISRAVQIIKGYAKFRRCSFIDNFFRKRLWPSICGLRKRQGRI